MSKKKDNGVTNKGGGGPSREKYVWVDHYKDKRGKTMKHANLNKKVTTYGGHWGVKRTPSGRTGKKRTPKTEKKNLFWVGGGR